MDRAADLVQDAQRVVIGQTGISVSSVVRFGRQRPLIFPSATGTNGKLILTRENWKLLPLMPVLAI